MSAPLLVVMFGDFDAKSIIINRSFCDCHEVDFKTIRINHYLLYLLILVISIPDTSRLIIILDIVWDLDAQNLSNSFTRLLFLAISMRTSLL